MDLFSFNKVILRRVKSHMLCFAFGFSAFLILSGWLGNQYTDSSSCRPSAARDCRNTENYEKITKLQFINITNLLNETFKKITRELKDYDFNYSDIGDLVLESGGQPLRTLIISTWRSGSTFLGEILNAMPGNFYHYEPFLNYSKIQIRGPPHAHTALTTIKNMFRCIYDNMEDYYAYGKTHLYQFSHNTRLWEQCEYAKTDLCFNAKFTSKLCKLFPFHSMKVVRFRLNVAEEILQDEGLNVKVVLLIRDPRGVMRSRMETTFCRPHPDCWEPKFVCADMVSDYVAARRLLKKYPDRLMVLRYEELAMDPFSMTRELYKFLGINMMPQVEEYLATHVNNNEVPDQYKTFRVSHDVPFKWKNKLDYQYVAEIQMACKKAMYVWGYRMAFNASHMTSKEFNPIDTYSIE